MPLAENFPLNDRIRTLRKQGVGPREIARRLKVSPGSVAGVLHRSALTAEKRGRGHGADDALKASVIADRLETGDPYSTVGKRHGVDTMTVWCWVNGRKPGGPGSAQRRRRV